MYENFDNKTLTAFLTSEFISNMPCLEVKSDNYDLLCRFIDRDYIEGKLIRETMFHTIVNIFNDYGFDIERFLIETKK